MRRSLTDRGVAALKPRASRYTFPDPELRGLYIRIQPSGAKSFVAVTVAPSGKQIWHTIGPADAISIEVARAQAREVLTRLRSGLPAVDAPQAGPASFAEIAENFLKRHVEANGLITRREIERCLRKYIMPGWGNRAFVDIRRSDIAKLLDDIEDNHGAAQADVCLSIVRGIASWHAKRHDDYQSPFIRGMQRAKKRARSRILDDDEIRALWKATEASQFGDFVRLLLLTGQRRARVAGMRWADVSLDGTWHVPSAEREKQAGGALLLPPIALEIVQRQPRLGDNPYVFAASRGNTGFITGFVWPKRSLDAKLPADMPNWTLHDLRRTARSLLSRAGVRPDIADRVLGHVVGSTVQQTYDRHSFAAEKADALKRLAALIENIVCPQENVVPLLRGTK